MLTIPGPKSRYCDGVTRRNFLKIGALSFGATTLTQNVTITSTGVAGGSFPLASYLAARLSRILPLYYLALLLTVVVEWLIAPARPAFWYHGVDAGTLGHPWGNAAGATANRVALEACVKARNEGRSLAADGARILAEAAAHSPALAVAMETWKDVRFEHATVDTLDVTANAV